MQKTHSKIHRTVVFIGLAAALALCVFSCIALGRERASRAKTSRSRPSIEELDARAKIHFDQAERNVPHVVAEMTSTGNFLKLCCFMVEDKISGCEKTQKFIESRIHTRIAAIEGFNNKIRLLTRQAYGFRDREYFKLKIHQLPEISCERTI